MLWWKLKRIYFDHPYFDHKKHILSEAEAEKLSLGFPIFEEMIDGAKKRFSLSPNAWSNFDEIIEAKSKNQKHQRIESLKTPLRIFRSHKRFAVVFLAFILIISFFTLVPFGRTLASDFINMIIRIIEGRIEVTSQNPDYQEYGYDNLIAEKYNINDASESIDNNTPIYYPDIEQFVAETGLSPVTIKSDWLRCQTIQSIEDGDLGMTLTVQYMTPEGLSVFVAQRWDTDTDIVFHVNDADYEVATILGNIELYHAVDPADGTFMGTALLNNSLLMIGAECDINVKQLLKELN